MKILVVTDRLGQELKTGSDIFCNALLDELRKYHEIVALGRSYAALTESQVLETGELIVNEATANDSRQLMQFIREHVTVQDFDLIYNLGGLVFNSKAINLLRMLAPELPVINHFQTLLVEYAKQEKLNELLQLQARDQQVSCIRGSALNIFLTLAEYRTALRHKFPIEQRASAIVPNALRPEEFEGVNPDYSFLPEQFSDAASRPTVLFTAGGFSDRTKGGDLAYRMFAELIRREKNVFLCAVTDTDRYTYLLRDVPPSRYTIVNWMERSLFLQHMAASDIVVVPSRYEAFGLVAAEAMMLGKPVVANAAGGLEEVVFHEVTGLLGEPKAGSWGLAQAVLRLLEDPEWARALGAAGKRTATREFNMERSAALVDRELRRAILHHEAVANVADIGITLV